MSRCHLIHSGRAALMVAALACGAVAVVVPPVAGAAPASPCGPLGTLVEYELNDRCDFNSLVDPQKVDNAQVIAGLTQAGLFATTVTCGDGSAVPVVARPNELLVTAGNRGQLAEAVAEVRRRLGNTAGRATPINGLAALVRVRPGTIDDVFLLRTIPTLQGESWSADLNYLEPAMPNNSFRPDDNPVVAEEIEVGREGRGTVLVLDSPAQRGAYPAATDLVLSTLGPAAAYDVDGNGLVDEDHGHGVFVASVVKRLAPGATVVLAGVNGGQVPGSARWSPMMFADADLVQAMGTAFGLSLSGGATRRSFDVVNMSLGGTGCDGVAARLGLGRFMRDLAVVASDRGPWPMYVAASGNDGGDVKHYPAAFRDDVTMKAAADAVDVAFGVAPSPAGDAIRALHGDLADGVLAVGSWTAGARDPFSNCGDWVNAIADGAGEISRYPSKTAWASWSGTSFATPRVSAALVGGADIVDVGIGVLGTC